MDLESTGEVIIKRVDLDKLINVVEQLQVAISHSNIEAKLDVLCGDGMVTSSVVKKIMGWSESTFQRRLSNEKNPIPMFKEDGGKRWVMTRQDFVKYYENVTN